MGRWNHLLIDWREPVEGDETMQKVIIHAKNIQGPMPAYCENIALVDDNIFQALLRVARAAKVVMTPTEEPLPEGWLDDWDELQEALAEVEHLLEVE
jgi:hypothetical protein